MKVILTAAGAMCRWKLDGELYGGVPKHLIPIGGEPLLWRTVRLLRERDVTDILIVGPDDPRYAIDGARLFVPADHVPWSGASRLHDCDKFLSSRSEWKTDGRTVILHGDVYLAEDAADSIVGYERREWCLFARYRRHWRPFHKLETIAFSFYPEDHAHFDAVLDHLVSLQNAGKLPRTGTWELYRGLRGDSIKSLRKVIRLLGHVVTPGHSVEIAPPTTDVDTPADYEGLIECLALVSRRSLRRWSGLREIHS